MSFRGALLHAVPLFRMATGAGHAFFRPLAQFIPALNLRKRFFNYLRQQEAGSRTPFSAPHQRLSFRPTP